MYVYSLKVNKYAHIEGTCSEIFFDGMCDLHLKRML